MKVLFAVSDENISESIVREYQKQYKEILSYKNVYYFNAIIKELQKDKSYDRIVISEDLEPFASNNYDSIDKFIFEKLDSISDEAIDPTGKETEIILITTERRSFGDNMLVKFFGIGVYSALIGKDKSIENVCKLIKRPRTKKEAKQYYKIDSEDVNYQTENENDVSETEIQNILSHYKKLGKNTDKYTDSFNNIVSQYNDAQLRVIINFLPVGVKAVLEAESPKYQEIVMSTGKRNTKQRMQNTTEYTPRGVENHKQKNVKMDNRNIDPDDIKIDMLENMKSSPKMTKPVVIPGEVNSITPKRKSIETPKVKNAVPVTVKMEDIDDIEEPEIEEYIEPAPVEQPKRGRGRPKKNPNPEDIQQLAEQPKRGRGRPKKVVEEDVNLFALQQEDDSQEEIEDSVNLFELDEQEEDNTINNNYIQPQTRNYIQTPNNNNYIQPQTSNYIQSPINNYMQNNNNVQRKMEEEYNNSIIERQYESNVNLSNLLTRDKKVVSFVGTTKNGTSFIVNNLAELISSMGISTAILDMTQSRNAYYIYTKNEESLRNIADKCINNLRSNIPEGIKVNKNLTVYTSVPGSRQNIEDVENILSTLLQNYSLVLIDCDFETPIEYFHNSQEIYLVQSMDVLTIQPLTAFLRDLKNKNILSNEQKLRIIINKEQRVGGLSPKVIIGGMAYYNDPSMSFMTELFDRTRIKYTTIPFEVQNYSAYLEALVNCDITLKQYTKLFNAKLKELANMVYPLIERQYGKGAFNKRY